MSLVGRYTTPTHIFTVPFDTGTISMMAVIYKQGGNVVLVKDLADAGVTSMVAANENGTVKIYAAGAAPAAMSLQITKIMTY